MSATKTIVPIIGFMLSFISLWLSSMVFCMCSEAFSVLSFSLASFILSWYSFSFSLISLALSMSSMYQ